MQTRLTPCFKSAKPVATLELAGLPRFPFPCEFVSINLLHVNIPFAFPVIAPSGFVLVNVEGDATNVLTLNNARFPYTWCLPFEPRALVGTFQWFTQAANAGDDLYHTVRFSPTLRINLSFVGRDGASVFPPTPADKIC